MNLKNKKNILSVFKKTEKYSSSEDFNRQKTEPELLQCIYITAGFQIYLGYPVMADTEVCIMQWRNNTECSTCRNFDSIEILGCCIFFFPFVHFQYPGQIWHYVLHQLCCNTTGDSLHVNLYSTYEYSTRKPR